MTNTALTQDWEGDVLIIGAGPAGLAVAAEVGAPDRRVLLIDENQRPGGQITRRRMLDPSLATTPEPGVPADVTFVPAVVCHGFDDDGAAVLSAGGRLIRATARYTVLATGAVEKVLPMPGWTLPGVMTAGAAQALLKGSGIFPYRRVVVAGSGPLLIAAASDLVSAGVDVVTVVEASRPGVRDMRDMARAGAVPELLIQGAKYLSTLHKAGVSVRSRTAIQRVEGTDRVGGVYLARVDKNWQIVPGSQETVACDAVLLNHGFSSSTSLAAQRGADIEWDDQRLTWRPVRDSHFRTSVRGLYAVGDCAGVGGSHRAELEGGIAGAIIAADLTDGSTAIPRMRRSRAQLARHETFRRGMDHLYAPGAAAPEWADSDTEICRCQETTRGEIDHAIEHGAGDLRSIKLWTRAGMGPCQGQICNPSLCAVLESHGCPTGELAPPTPRFPVRPVPLGALADTPEPTTNEGAPWNASAS